ncbi:hypothetical protein SPRG_01247 [Saprolegnia parasitica CBS 223.65]|uniref:RING-type domain-containing protein n=1 Tax=Saprolegnia parasitica (strain CBS 223.65) TaxID=695850 RepID=A0A067D5H2_SAPPC|nr:hypothetical protein SPRG_01247 [Saprolegnia parasitica CBS 223.65]KDO33971.1 hypothetical protein SPRG_01247 [Saprolegnia parasitica CBS 223.65]|eukprot:XP_012194861.1 hypothetical protein SPRG_01247 [Saprolegnia parasitica CBS 223.65]
MDDAGLTTVRAACPRTQWVPDGARASCIGCAKAFYLLRRRHHCRVCGDIVCGRCRRTVYLLNTTSNVGHACPGCASAPEMEAMTRSMERPPATKALGATTWGDLQVAATECAICIEPYRDVRELVAQLPCKHVFHTRCIDPWLAGHDACPLCRRHVSLRLEVMRQYLSF